MVPPVPVFPLNLVAFPGMVVPLHVFEERYRAMVRSLLEVDPARDRCFAIVAIREGYEVGSHASRSMYRVGSLMQLTEAHALPDGRYDVVATGRHRVRVMEVDESGPFLRAQVQELHDPLDGGVDDTAAAAARALATFARYRTEVSRLRGDEVMVGALPRDPDLLSYTLASTCALTLPERQQLLEAPTAGERLALLHALMRRELSAMRAVPSLPATEVARTAWSPN